MGEWLVGNAVLDVYSLENWSKLDLAQWIRARVAIDLIAFSD
jgi:hypothetical protein